MTPQEILIKHEMLIKLILEHQYLPQKDAANFGEVVQALRQINPSAKYEMGCSGCIREITHMANVHLQEAKKSKFMTFPAHKKK